MRSRFMLIFCSILVMVSSCKTTKPQASNQPRPPREVRHTTDSLYGSMTPMQQLITDKQMMLDLLSKLQANEGLISHILEINDYDMHYLVFPLRIVQIVQPDQPKFTTPQKINQGISILNRALKDAWIQFQITEIDTIYAPITIQTLKEDGYNGYYNLSQVYDRKDLCTLYLVDNEDDLCRNFSCSRTSGFANVLSSITNSVVLDKFFVDDYKVVAHEFGHYFGLYHTSETSLFGRELVDGTNCLNSGDRICDTPADPGELYTVYVNFSNCVMEGLKEQESGLEYRPLINNLMSYYHPCYMKEFTFTKGQNEVILNAAVKVRHNQIIALAEFPL